MLTIHHLGHSQSERILWLCEELGVPYELNCHKRDPATRLAPPALAALHPSGAAPVITDGDIVLADSGAIVVYILARHDSQGLAPGPADANFADYLYWFHFANGTLQPVIMREAVLRWSQPAADNPMMRMAEARLARAYGLIESRLAVADYLAGGFSAADIMVVFSLTTMRLFRPMDLSAYPAILRYLHRIGARPAYQRAMRKGDPDIVPVLAAR